MKPLSRKLTIASACVFLGLSGASLVKAQSTDNDSCGDSTLKGDYAFTVSGQIFIPDGPTVQREGVAMTRFDGSGGLSQVDMVFSSPNATPPPPGFASPTDPVTRFNINETGTYTVYSDCTGTFTINFPDLVNNTTGAHIKGAIIVTHFVLSNGGRAIHTIVTSLTPPGAPGPVPVLIRSEGHKLDPLPKA